MAETEMVASVLRVGVTQGVTIMLIFILRPFAGGRRGLAVVSEISPLVLILTETPLS